MVVAMTAVAKIASLVLALAVVMAMAVVLLVIMVAFAMTMAVVMVATAQVLSSDGVGTSSGALGCLRGGGPSKLFTTSAPNLECIIRATSTTNAETSPPLAHQHPQR